MAIVINGSGTVTGISVGGLPDDIVDAGTLADNAVGLAQMAGGTDGNVITYDTSGNPAVVATGSDGQVLTSAGADAVPAFEAVAAGSTPAFYAHLNDTEQIEAAHSTVTVMNDSATGDSLTEAYDTDSAFDPATGRFTPQTAGWYMINWSGIGNPDASTQHPFRVDMRKNGTTIARGESREKNDGGSDTMQVALQAIVQFNGSSDYVEVGVWTYAYTGGSTSLKVEWINFSGFLIKAT